MYKIYVTRYMLRSLILIIDSYIRAQIDNYLISAHLASAYLPIHLHI
jgi:hypothetical protein